MCAGGNTEEKILVHRLVDVLLSFGFVAIEARFLDCGPMKAIGPSLGMTIGWRVRVRMMI